MPTLGWIQETAVERYLVGTEQPLFDPNPSVPCPHCERLFFTVDELSEHLGIDHPLSIPIILIGVRTAGKDNVVRQKPEKGAFRVLNCTSCTLSKNGEAVARVDPSQLPSLLSAERSSICDIQLANERTEDRNVASASIRIAFRVPDSKALGVIDTEFVRRLAVDHPRLSDVDDFRRSCPQSPAAIDYASALGDYVIGLALKERHPDAGVFLDFEDYRSKFTSSLNVLQGFSRPVAQSVAATIRFNFNDFSTAPAQVPDLAGAREFFRSILHESATTSAPEGGEIPHESICPVDIVTFRILGLACKLRSGQVPHPLLLKDLDELVRWEPLSEYDGLKVRALAAIANQRLGRMDDAIRDLRRLQFTVPFDRWAQSQLSKLTQNENAAS